MGDGEPNGDGGGDALDGVPVHSAGHEMVDGSAMTETPLGVTAMARCTSAGMTPLALYCVALSDTSTTTWQLGSATHAE